MAVKIHHAKELKSVGFAEERATLAIESADLGVFEMDIQSDTIETNRRMDAIFGSGKPLSRKKYIETIHPEDVPLRNSAFADAMATGHIAYEVRIVWDDGSVHWIKIAGRVFYDEQERPAKMLGVVQEITEQKEFEVELAKQVDDRTRDLLYSNQELQIINAELQQYVHVSSHDLQEPLRKIRIYTEMILKRDHDKLSEASKTHFTKINAAAERLSTSLKDLLNFNSINKEDHYSAVDLNEVVRMAESDLELIVSQKSAVINYTALPVIRAIPVQMHQLFYNLLNNALKFSQGENAPQVDIRVNSISSQNAHQYHHLDGSRKYLEIIVKDNGIGFDQNNAEKIFNMFQRLHDRRVFSGTGIGLALCKKVVQNHAGKIWASSAAGKGASFHIILPRD
ncbi:MAG: PAS domain-containing protein [Chitinophagaceae bacterium]|nr:PAS domain-containing protein [Chitinophagaceae bacterium]